MSKILLIENDGFALASDRRKISLNEQSIPPASLIREGNSIYINALLQRAEAENKNGRIYPKAILQREYDRMLKMILAGNALGECDHPEESVVSLKNNPHRIVEMWWDGNDLYGKLQLLVSKAYLENGSVTTMIGDTIATYIDLYGINIGISSRGVGSLKNVRGKNYVQDDFELLCWDLVHNPSTHNAYLYGGSPLRFEGKESEKSVISESNRMGKYRKLL